MKNDEAIVLVTKNVDPDNNWIHYLISVAAGENGHENFFPIFLFVNITYRNTNIGKSFLLQKDDHVSEDCNKIYWWNDVAS